MSAVFPYEPLDALIWAVRRRAPDVDVVRLHSSLAENPWYVRVSCREVGPWRVVWDEDAEVYLWSSGTYAGREIGGTNVSDVADAIVHALRVAVDTDGPHARSPSGPPATSRRSGN